jgi:hypothetical protein
VREPWRWVLRGVAVLALVAGGVFLGLYPVVRIPPPIVLSAGNHYPAPTTQCLSPFNRVTGEIGVLNRHAITVCSAATNGQEHIAEALGFGAIVLIGLSFLPRRRALATKPLAFSRL